MSTIKLLPYQRKILEQLSAPSPDSDGLLLLARGLGMRNILCSFLEVFAEEESLVVVVNATPEEETGLAEELGMRLTVIGFETPFKDREACYKKGGIVSVTTRILIIDMLLERIPVALITGLVVLHAEAVTPTSMEAFVMRVYREKNKNGFIKAFSDEPESFTYGVAPLQTVLTQLHIRNVFLYPRFHESISADLEKEKGDVLNLHQPLSESMDVIQTAIIECMDATLAELRRSNTTIEVENLTVQNALFRSFDTTIKAQLDPQWHRVGPKTRQLVSDLTTLRNLLVALLSFDAVSFNQFLDTILASNTENATGKNVGNQSPWLFLPAANTIFETARNRVYKKVAVQPEAEREATVAPEAASRRTRESTEGYWDEGDDSLFASQEALALVGGAAAGASGEEMPDVSGSENPDESQGGGKSTRNKTSWAYWSPAGTVPVLEEQPKWFLLREILEEIENQIHWQPVDWEQRTNDTILIMCNTSRDVAILRRYLSSISELDRDVDNSNSMSLNTGGRDILLARASEYFLWKGSLGRMSKNMQTSRNGISYNKERNQAIDYADPVAANPANGKGPHFESAALKRKSAYKRGQPMNKRRRVRGGGAGFNPNERSSNEKKPAGNNANILEAESVELAENAAHEGVGVLSNSLKDVEEEFDPTAFDEYFGLCDPQQTVIIRAYGGDEDDKVLEEIRPRFVIMYDPDPAYVRRIETYRASHPGTKVQVYFMMYANSAEEQRYLSQLRRERESFERLIKERSSMAIALQADRRPNEDRSEDFLRTVNSRIAGGGKHARADPPKVIVDLREFRSSLPSLLHAAGFIVVPLTLTTGDYVITPEMAVERKSIPDLIQSLNSGRLYQQCEVMSLHYTIPVLLIEFDHKKSFSLETYAGIKGNMQEGTDTDLYSKLTLLTLTFPRLRIIWSSSPFATADIFADLKQNRDEPEPSKAAALGAEEGDGNPNEAEASVNQTPQELLRSLPGITTKNYHYVMEKTQNMEELARMELADINKLIGVEAGRQLHKFMNHSLLKRDEAASSEVPASDDEDLPA